MAYKLYTDGSYAIEDEIAGYGGYIAGLNKTLLEFSEQITQPQLFKWHERLALKRGLELALQKGIKNLSCYMDDKSLAQQVQKLTSPMIENNDNCLNDIIALKSKFKKITFFYIPREENKKADKLSRQAIKNIPIYLKTPNIILNNNDEYKNSQNSLHHCLFFYATNDIHIFYITKDHNNLIIDTKLVNTISGKGNDFNYFIHTVKETVKSYSHIDHLTLSTFKGSGKRLEHMLRGNESINASKSDIRSLNEQLSLCHKISYYNDPSMIKYILEQYSLFTAKTKDTIMNNIKHIKQRSASHSSIDNYPIINTIGKIKP